MKKFLFILSVCLMAFVSCSDPTKTNTPKELTEAQCLRHFETGTGGWYYYDVTTDAGTTTTYLKYYVSDEGGHKKGDVERAGTLRTEYKGEALELCKSSMSFVQCYRAYDAAIKAGMNNIKFNKCLERDW
ncbi:MAG: hypothetical protein MJ185_05145 [Treponema sp.]|nr:hypothetical protein [Treponema sp.]